MKYRLLKLWSLIMLLAFALTALLPAASFASVEGRRNTTYALGAVALYSLLKGKDTQALIAGAGTYYAYRRYSDAKEDQRKRERRYYRYYQHRR